MIIWMQGKSSSNLALLKKNFETKIELFESDPDFDLKKLKDQYKMTVTHTTDYSEDMQPIITLAQPMVGWEVGDRIIIGRKVPKNFKGAIHD